MIALELRLTIAGLRRILLRPTRRTLWLVLLVLLVCAATVDIATAHNVERDLGNWQPSPFVAIVAAVLVLTIAAVSGSMTMRPYGVRVADTIWWRYAGIHRVVAERHTATISIVRVAFGFAALGVPLGAVFALASPTRAIVIFETVASATLVAAAARCAALVCSRTAENTGEKRRLRRAERPMPDVPSGIVSARWLIATRGRAPLVPTFAFFVAAIAGIVLARLALVVNGQTVSLAVVIGPIALLLAAALRTTGGRLTLLSPWWRSAIGTGPRQLLVWSIAASLPSMFSIAGFALGAAAALGRPLSGFAFLVPMVAIAPSSRLLSLAVEVVFPAHVDGRSAAAFVRVGLHAGLIAVMAYAVWCAAPLGVIAMLAAGSAIMVATMAMAVSWITARLGRMGS